MKFLFIPREYVLLVLILTMSSYTFSNKLYNNQINELYRKKGTDWTGICNEGDKQSPINIILHSNTLDTSNQITVDYKIDSSMVNKQLFYDGDRLSMELNLGQLTYTNSADGVQEVYEAYKLEIHYPSEHYVTLDKLTPRYEVELQIFHNLVKTNNQVVTNSQIKVNRAIVSILFSLGQLEEGDVFFNNLGISKYNINQFGDINIPKHRQSVNLARPLPASWGTGFNYNAFQGLLNLINNDPGVFYYYGSETSPPCREDVLWMVFSKPRSLSKTQIDFFKTMISKQVKSPRAKGVHINESGRLYGNNRRIVLYDDSKRGKIMYNKTGLKHVNSNSFFMKDDPTELNTDGQRKPSNIYDS